MEKIPILLMFLGHVWVDTSQGVLPIVLVKLKEAFSLNYFEVGLVTAVLNISSSVIQPVFGYVSDRLRTGWFVPVGILWTALAMGLLGWSPNYPSAALLVGLAGLGTAAFHPRAMMAVSLVSGTRRGLGIGIFATGGNLGFAMGPVVGSFLVLGFGLHATMGLLGPGLLVALVIFFYPGDFLRREAPAKRKEGPEGGKRADPIPWGSLSALCLIVTLRSWVYSSFITFLPMFLRNQGLPLKSGSLMLTVFLACGAAAGLYGGHLSDRVGRRRIIAVSMLLYPVLASMLIMARGPWQWVFAGASGAAILSSFSVTLVLAQELLPRHLGLASGLVLGLGFGAGGVGVALTGHIADLAGLPAAVWFLATLPVLGALFSTFIRTRPDAHRVAIP